MIFTEMTFEQILGILLAGIVGGVFIGGLLFNRFRTRTRTPRARKKTHVAAIALILIGLSACTGNENDVNRILEGEGCVKIELLGWSPFGCSEDDNYGIKFRAVKNGKVVIGVVCGGFHKGYTIRYY